ncbi:MAG: nucleoside transporter, partial [Glaciecola sp.]
FAEVCAPWMILMFIVGALVMLPTTVLATAGVDGISSFSDFLKVANDSIWIDNDSDIGIWHVAAFAWIANLAMHGSLGDMTLLRFAKKSKYGYFSALGMFIGHYIAWVCAGIMGAGAAILLNTSITAIDPGTVAFSALGASGILAVIIAGWTTSNPTIYRAGLAFSSLNHAWGRTRVTIVVGIITTIIACSPFVFSKLLGFVGYMGMLLAPVGAIIVTEHWLFAKLGLTRYWSKYKGNTTNIAALATWIISVVAGITVEQTGLLHLFFILIPLWIFATVLYIGLASVMGAKETYSQAAEHEAAEFQRKEAERAYLANDLAETQANPKKKVTTQVLVAKYASYLALISCAYLGVMSYATENIDLATTWLLLPTLIYFVTATYAMLQQDKN